MLHDRAQDTDDGQMRQSSKEDLHPTSFVQVGSAPEGARWALRLILLGRPEHTITAAAQLRFPSSPARTCTATRVGAGKETPAARNPGGYPNCSVNSPAARGVNSKS